MRTQKTGAATMSKNGTLLCAALAGLLTAAAPFAARAEGKNDTADKKVKCEGINKCAGHGSCRSAANACGGKNGCAGKGWVETTEKECRDKGGKIVAEK
jgi:hypothetical protein